jgi:hypothetical protein
MYEKIITYFNKVQKKDKNIAVVSFVIKKMEVNVSLKANITGVLLLKGNICGIEANSKS